VRNTFFYVSVRFLKSLVLVRSELGSFRLKNAVWFEYYSYLLLM